LGKSKLELGKTLRSVGKLEEALEVFNDMKEGDIVKVYECRPLSKSKNFVIVEKAGSMRGFHQKMEARLESKKTELRDSKKEEIKAPEAAAPEEAPAEGEAAAEAEKTDAAGAEPKAEEPKKEAAKE